MNMNSATSVTARLRRLLVRAGRVLSRRGCTAASDRVGDDAMAQWAGSRAIAMPRRQSPAPVPPGRVPRRQRDRWDPEWSNDQSDRLKEARPTSPRRSSARPLPFEATHSSDTASEDAVSGFRAQSGRLKDRDHLVGRVFRPDHLGRLPPASAELARTPDVLGDLIQEGL